MTKRVCTPKYIKKRNAYVCTTRVNKNIHRSNTYNSSKLETNQMAVINMLDK